MYAALANINFCSGFLVILDFQHNDIKFTMEKVSKTLNFLEVEIELNNVCLNTCVWRKLQVQECC